MSIGEWLLVPFMVLGILVVLQGLGMVVVHFVWTRIPGVRRWYDEHPGESFFYGKVDK